MAVFKANKTRFLVTGAHGLSLYLPHFVDGDLEVYLNPDDAPGVVAALTASGFRLHVDDDRGQAVVDYAGYIVKLLWRLADPLGGPIDEAWFENATRNHLLGIRVKVAPMEELLWVRIAVPGAASLSDPLVQELLRERGRDLDWGRLLSRLSGLEALFLAHLFLFHHTQPEIARQTIPAEVFDTLLRRMNAGAGESVELSVH